jgi:hypothetical protein
MKKFLILAAVILGCSKFSYAVEGINVYDGVSVSSWTVNTVAVSSITSTFIMASTTTASRSPANTAVPITWFEVEMQNPNSKHMVYSMVPYSTSPITSSPTLTCSTTTATSAIIPAYDSSAERPGIQKERVANYMIYAKSCDSAFGTESLTVIQRGR